MGTNLIALMKYEGVSDRTIRAISLLETRPNLFGSIRPAHAVWKLWSGRGWNVGPRPQLPSYHDFLEISQNIWITIGTDMILIRPSDRWSALFAPEVQSSVIAKLTKFCLVFNAEDCLVTH